MLEADIEAFTSTDVEVTQSPMLWDARRSGLEELWSEN